MKLKRPFKSIKENAATFIINPDHLRVRTLYSEPWVCIELNTRTNMLEITTRAPCIEITQQVHRLPIFLEMKGHHLEAWIKKLGIPFTKNLEDACYHVCNEVVQYIKDVMVHRDKVIYASEVMSACKDNPDFTYNMEVDKDLVSYATKVEYDYSSLGWVITHRGCSPYSTLEKDMNVYFTAKLSESEPHL